MILALLLACTDEGPETCPEVVTPAPGQCAQIFSDPAIQDFHLELSDATWAALQEDYVSWRERPPEDRKPYHPVETFRWGCETLTTAQIRLKGNPCCSWEGNKLQFVIAFQQTDSSGRFLGLRKIAFDAPFYDPTLLSERLAFSVFDDLDSTSSCANHARLHINGSYYGLYTLVEMIDKEYLQRHFDGDDDEGNLYKFDYGMATMELRTNEDEGNTADYDTLLPSSTYTELDAVFDFDQAMKTWAAETIVNQSDGYWAGSLNFYQYHHPTRGWMIFPWDLDHAFDFWPAGVDPLNRRDYYGISWHLDRVLEDPVGRERYIDAVKSAYADYDVGRVLERLDTLEATIHDDLALDVHKPFSMPEHEEAVEQLEALIIARDSFLQNWVVEH